MLPLSVTLHPVGTSLESDECDKPVIFVPHLVNGSVFAAFFARILVKIHIYYIYLSTYYGNHLIFGEICVIEYQAKYHLKFILKRNEEKSHFSRLSHFAHEIDSDN